MSKTANLDWANLGFEYSDTRCHIKYTYRNGAWDRGVIAESPYLNLHIAATSIHYGQAVFEGLKAFRSPDGAVRVFRVEKNAKRMAHSAERIMMEPPPADIFREGVMRAVRENIDYAPPHGTGATLYIRPLLIGSSPRIGLQPAEEYTFIVLVTPVGPYYKSGFTPVQANIITEYDRAAPHGLGDCKVAGNYAAGILAQYKMKKEGYPISLFLDAKEQKYINEFGTSNFFAITADGEYATPDSSTILKSITNNSLMTLAEEFGLDVNQRPIPVAELEHLSEVGACGTATAVTPIHSIDYHGRRYTYGEPDKPGHTLVKLYERLTSIQFGTSEDTYDWMTPVE